jgi:hypothetical protein
MEINTNTTTIYNFPNADPEVAPDEREDTISIWRLPKIAWASGILFSVNLLIAGAIAISPELNVNIYGEAVGDVVFAGTKPSPFVEPEAPPRKVRAAVKMTPIVEFLPEVSAMLQTAGNESMVASPAAIPAAYRQPAYVSGSQAYEAAERQMDFPRITASLMPKGAVPATFTGTQEVTPRKVTDREAKPTVIN